MGKQVTAGYGDSCTWGPYLGHSNDPRTKTVLDGPAADGYDYDDEEEEENEL